MNTKIRKLTVAIIVISLLFSLISLPALADTGPKPSVEVSISGFEAVSMQKGVYYATLLSKTESTGPASVWDGDEEHIYSNLGKEKLDIFYKFAEYRDEDGFYFLQNFWECAGNDSFRWGYYPPSAFKVLLYFPEADTFLVSGVLERYAFDSYFDIDLTELSPNEGESLVAKKNYDYTAEALTFLLRLVFTLITELSLAILFFGLSKKRFAFIAAVNIITQLILNIALSYTYHFDAASFIYLYGVWELLIIIAEAIAISAYLCKKDGIKHPVLRAAGYSVVANVLSYFLGLWLSQFIPAMF